MSKIAIATVITVMMVSGVALAAPQVTGKVTRTHGQKISTTKSAARVHIPTFPRRTN